MTLEINNSDSGFKLCRVPELPRLAWCAEIQAGNHTARLLCGDLVESQKGIFAAGAWSGDYAGGKPDEAEVMAGSAGRSVSGGFVFAAPSHTMEWIHYVRNDNTLYVSNSLPFLLAEIGDSPDLAYPDYYFDVLETYRAGLSTTGRTLTTAGGKAIEPVVARNLHVGFDLSVSLKEKPRPIAPGSFEDYSKFMQRSVELVVNNALSSARQHSFAPLVTVSRGYDSVATAALAKMAGCKTALTLRDRSNSSRLHSDNGKPVCDALGLELKEYDRQSAGLTKHCDDWEFCINPHAGTDKDFLMFSEALEGRLFLTGRRGDTHWSLERGLCQPNLQEPNALILSGTTLIEPSLRLGFIHFPVPTCGAIQAPALARLARSEQMKPWSVSGKYDRPIARRIAEEAGVGRELFGMEKHGGSGIPRESRFTAESYRDFQNFLANKVPHKPRGDLLTGWIPHPFKRRLHRLTIWLRGGSRWQLYLAKLIGNRLHPNWRNYRAYYIHWAWIRTSEHYKAALAKTTR